MNGGYCKGRIDTFVNKELNICQSAVPKTESECEADCTSLGSCVGYMVDTGDHYCALIPSNNNCPNMSTYQFYERGVFAATLRDLTSVQRLESSFATFRCYGKINGNYIDSFVYHL